MSIQTTFSKNLKKLRKSSGMTQEEFALKLSVSVKYLQRLEGKSCPNIGIKTLEKVGRALKVEPYKLIK